MNYENGIFDKIRLCYIFPFSAFRFHRSDEFDDSVLSDSINESPATGT
jgi:hypothetical protein